MSGGEFSYLARSIYFALRRPRIRRATAVVETEYSEGWNQYWEHLKRARTLEEWLRIPGIEDAPFFHSDRGRLRLGAFDSAVYYRERLLEALGRHFPEAASVTEYGAGLGRNVLFLKSRLPALQVYGYELCRPGVEIARHAAEKFGIECSFSQLDYVGGDSSRYVFPTTDLAYTMFSLEQIPRDNRRAVMNMHAHSRLGSIHVEPVPENYPYNLRGLVGRVDHWKVDYLRSFDRNVRSLGLAGVVQETLASSHNPLMYPSLYVLKK